MEPKIDLSSITLNEDLNESDSTDTITLSGYPWSNTTIAGGGYTVSNASISASSYPYSVGTGTNYPNLTLGGAGTGIGITSPWSTYTGAPTLNLNGEGADIKVNDWSLVEAIQKIEERLNILHPNTKLEAEWEELRELGTKYRELEQHIKDKQATWDRLKAMPLPKID